MKQNPSIKIPNMVPTLFRASTKNASTLFDIRPSTWHFKTSAHGAQGHTIAFGRKTFLQQRQESVALLFSMSAVFLKWWLVPILLSLQQFQYQSFGSYMALQHRTLSLQNHFCCVTAPRWKRAGFDSSPLHLISLIGAPIESRKTTVNRQCKFWQLQHSKQTVSVSKHLPPSFGFQIRANFLASYPCYGILCWPQMKSQSLRKFLRYVEKFVATSNKHTGRLLNRAIQNHVT